MSSRKLDVRKYVEVDEEDVGKREDKRYKGELEKGKFLKLFPNG